MEEKDLIEYMLKNNAMNASLRITTILNILTNAMIEKGWFTEEEFNKGVEEGLEKIAQASLNKMSEEQKKLLETQVKLSKDDLFGRFFQ